MTSKTRPELTPQIRRSFPAPFGKQPAPLKMMQSSHIPAVRGFIGLTGCTRIDTGSFGLMAAGGVEQEPAPHFSKCNGEVAEKGWFSVLVPGNRAVLPSIIFVFFA